MITIVLMTLNVCFLLEMLLLGFHTYGIAVCILTVLLEIFHLMLRKKIQLDLKYEKYVRAGGILLLLAVILLASGDRRKSYITEYNKELKKVEKLQAEDRTKEALQLLDEIQEKYGLRDAIVLERTTCYMIDSNYEAALQAIRAYSYRGSQTYYRLLENIYLQMQEDGQAALYDLYIEAAGRYPAWIEMQMKAGLVKLERKEFSSAKYYFTRANKLNMEDGMSAYYLGLTAYYMGSYEECLYRFNEAIGKGISDEITQEIANYVVVKQEDK